MAEIDQSKLPGVKEVCRDFAVLEDHTLAHSLQEQEIEHHLATNVQRNRLVQYDLQMAKQLQEEEDRKARTRIQEQHKNLERQDCEIAQEIQVKLVIEAEQRRRQEEDDEDIARILQQKELQEEKRRKKPPLEASQPSTHEEGSHRENRDRQHSSPAAGQPPEQSRSWSGDRRPRQPRDGRRGPPFVSEGLDLEVLGSFSEEARKAKEDRRDHRERKPGGRERPGKEAENGRFDRGNGRAGTSREGKSASAECLRGPSPLRPEPRHGSQEPHERRPRSRERPLRPSHLLLEREDEGPAWANDSRRRGGRSPGSEKSLKPSDRGAEGQEEGRYGRPPDPRSQGLPCHEGRTSPRPSSHDHRLLAPDTPPQRGRKKTVEREEGRRRDGVPPAASPSRHGGSLERDPRHVRHPGTKSRGAKDTACPKPRGAPAQDLESYDAEIARKLQEEELMASQVDLRAAQVAQDEEIARLLMAQEKAAYKKAREREKSSTERKRQDPDWKPDGPESVHPRPREGRETHRGRSDKPTRPLPPPTEDLDHLVNLTSQQNSTFQIPKPDSSQKGFHYKP